MVSCRRPWGGRTRWGTRRRWRPLSRSCLISIAAKGGTFSGGTLTGAPRRRSTNLWFLIVSLAAQHAQAPTPDSKRLACMPYCRDALACIHSCRVQNLRLVCTTCLLHCFVFGCCSLFFLALHTLLFTRLFAVCCLCLLRPETGGLFRLAVGLMQAFSDNRTCYTPLLDQLALYFQIRDDLINLASTEYMKGKSFCEDLTVSNITLLHAPAGRTCPSTEVPTFSDVLMSGVSYRWPRLRSSSLRENAPDQRENGWCRMRKKLCVSLIRFLPGCQCSLPCL